MLVRWAPDGHVWHFPYNLPVHCKIQRLRSHAHRLIPPGCDAAQQWLDDSTCCRTQRWDQDHLVLGPACDIPPDHQIFGPHNTFSETHERHLWVNIIMISNYMSFVYQTSVSLIHHWILLLYPYHLYIIHWKKFFQHWTLTPNMFLRTSSVLYEQQLGFLKLFRPFRLKIIYRLFEIVQYMISLHGPWLHWFVVLIFQPDMGQYADSWLYTTC